MNNDTDCSDWKPVVTQHGLELRASVYADLREFFNLRGVLEVDTPILNSFTVTDPNIESLLTANENRNTYLQTSPEYAMKRLIAHFNRDIYQICKVFRAEELGSSHHPEFTMLEWYRTGWSYIDLMHEVDALVKYLAHDHLKLGETNYFEYEYVFKEYCNINLKKAVNSDYVQAFNNAQISLNIQLSIKEYQELLLDQVIAYKLPGDRLTFIYNFPKEQAALAQINKDGAAMRFELYLGKVELANGFQELTDCNEQLNRFESDNQTRQDNSKTQIEIDKKFIAALQEGMPECAGVAIGVDRLLMLMLGITDIKKTLTFPNA